MENCLIVSDGVNKHLLDDAENPLLGMHSTEMSAHVHWKTSTRMFTAASFIVIQKVETTLNVHA